MLSWESNGISLTEGKNSLPSKRAGEKLPLFGFRLGRGAEPPRKFDKRGLRFANYAKAGRVAEEAVRHTRRYASGRDSATS